MLRPNSVSALKIWNASFRRAHRADGFRQRTKTAFSANLLTLCHQRVSRERIVVFPADQRANATDTCRDHFQPRPASDNLINSERGRNHTTGNR